MTTNAVLLEQQLPALLEAGLDSVNISLDTLDPALFAKITARDEFAAVQAGIHAALESGIPVKLNCVPQVGVNEGELEALAALAQDKPLQVRFIEMMPIGYGAAMPVSPVRNCWPASAGAGRSWLRCPGQHVPRWATARRSITPCRAGKGTSASSPLSTASSAPPATGCG